MRSSIVHAFLRAVVPAPIRRSIEMYLAQRQALQRLKEQGLVALGVRVAQHFGYRVQAGPFAGMLYSKRAVQTRHATPSLLGEYERQLHPFLEESLRRVELVIDIGAAEGYYAIGCARRDLPVVAFEVNGRERRVCREMARANGVSRCVALRSWCSPQALTQLIAGKRALVICDIEGGEYRLLPPILNISRHCDFVVELHGDAASNQTFAQSFSNWTLVRSLPLSSQARSRVTFLGDDANRAAREYRNEDQQWLLANGAE